MAEHLNEEEQVEAIKKWWSENGKSVVGGVVLGLALVGGWRGWQHYEQNRAETAGARYDEMLVAAEVQRLDHAVQLAEGLRVEFDDTAYASLAALHAAKLKLEAGDPGAAQVQLAWVRTNAPDPGLRQIASLRLARILIDEGELDAAQRILDAAPRDAFTPELAELRGDVARARGDVKAARAAYEEALAGKPGSGAILRLKLDDLPAAGGKS
jgi:predicted negative regulator of RcsB-dependent stress response